MNATHVAPDARGEARWGEGTAVVGGSEPHGEHAQHGRSFPAEGHPHGWGLLEPDDHRGRHPDAGSQSDERSGDGRSHSPFTHASFFSGVGGLDIGLERAGWRTVSFSEIDPYACSVLAQHWPDVPNLGDITAVRDVPQATLWTGGFPCTDLSIAGKRAGLTNDDGSLTRSGLAFAFLDLVERHRPEAILLENVYGLFSSHSGRDLGRLIRQMDELGYVGAWRGTDSQWFGVPQRRKRVFILAFDAQRHPDPDGPGTVLAVGTRCPRDHKSEREAWAQVAPGVGDSPMGGLYVGPVDGAFGHHGVATPQQSLYMGHYISGPVRTGNRLTRQELDDTGSLVAVDRAPADPRGVRAPDGMARRLDDQPLVASTLNSGGNSGGFRTEPGEHIVAGHFVPGDDDLLPIGLDSHRYRCIGNGVVAPVAYWIGTRLRRYFETCA